jgi:23S rRNA G2445 N2-methylase RlmL
MMEKYKSNGIELRLGRWQDVLDDIVQCDALITDPPYSERTHKANELAHRYASLQLNTHHYLKTNQSTSQNTGRNAPRIGQLYSETIYHTQHMNRRGQLRAGIHSRQFCGCRDVHHRECRVMVLRVWLNTF